MIDRDRLSAPQTGRSRLATSGNQYVPEIAGLRTVALLLVASFHIWFGRVSGGVDIFLFVGAYLMTRSLAARADMGEFTRPLKFIIRKFARLMPAAIAAIALTVVAVLLLTAPRTWGTLFDQAFASGTYWMNIWLQQEAVDYWATNRYDSSFFQHYWSLSLQGQVFILWPILHLASEGFARLTKIRPRTVLIAVFSTITAVSFIYAVLSARENAELAYFDFTARLWEFSIGSLLALVTPYLSFPKSLRRIMTGIGLVGIVTCGAVMPLGAPYPSWPALWPILCAILVLSAADAPRNATDKPDPILGNPILQRIGSYTYALYLTHWPVLILYANLSGQNVPSPAIGLLLLAISFLAAFAITRLVERPLAAWSRGEKMKIGWRPQIGLRTVAIVLVGVIATLGISFGGNASVELASQNARDQVWLSDVSGKGPQAPPDSNFNALLPADIVVKEPADAPGTFCPDDEWSAGLCVESGDPSSERSIVVIGNSHAMAFTGMIYETNHQQNIPWHLRSFGAPGCIYPGEGHDEDESCNEIWETGLNYIQEKQPDLLMILGTVSETEAPDLLHDGNDLPDIRPFVQEVVSSSTTDVVVIRDVPRFPFLPYQCGDRNGFDSPECVMPTPPDPAGLAEFATSIDDMGATWVDLNDAICPEGSCQPTMGGLVTYLDTNHITGIFSRSLAQDFSDRIRPTVTWWPSQIW